MFQWKRPATIFCLFGPVYFKDELILAVTHLKNERTMCFVNWLNMSSVDLGSTCWLLFRVVGLINLTQPIGWEQQFKAPRKISQML